MCPSIQAEVSGREELCSAVQAVLCVKNAENLLPRCLRGLEAAGMLYSNIIVVDGMSDDGSRKIAEDAGCRVLSDGGEGFVAARTLGIVSVTSPYTLILGPDDELGQESIALMLNSLESDPKLAAIQAGKTIDPSLRGFFSEGMRFYYEHLPVGPAPVIGNPSLYRTELLVRLPYDKQFSADEDTDWCERVRHFGFEVARLPELVSTEFESMNKDSFRSRWLWYGQGDYVFFRKYLRLQRRVAVRHLLHPFREYALRLVVLALTARKPAVAGFFLYVAMLRYAGFLSAMLSFDLSGQRLRGS